MSEAARVQQVLAERLRLAPSVRNLTTVMPPGPGDSHMLAFEVDAGAIQLHLWEREEALVAAQAYLIPPGDSALHLNYWRRHDTDLHSPEDLAQALWNQFEADEHENATLGRRLWMPDRLPPTPSPRSEARAEHERIAEEVLGSVLDLFG